MKYLCTIAVLFMVIGTYAQNRSTFTIKVLLNKAGGSPVEGVNFDGGLAGISPVYKGNGKYELTVSDRKPGETIKLEIIKAGHEVVNWEFQEITIPDPAARKVLEFLLCKNGQAVRWREHYYKIFVQNNIDKSTSGLPGNSGADDNLVRQIVQAIASTRKEEVDGEYTRAFARFIAHDYNGAKEILSIEKLSRDQWTALEIKQQAEQLLLQANKKLELRAAVAVGEANIDTALYCYKLIARSDSANLSAVAVIASLLIMNGNNREALYWIERTRKIQARSNEDSLKLILLDVIGQGLTGTITMKYLDSLEKRLPSIAYKKGPTAAGLYLIFAVYNLALENTSKGLQLFRQGVNASNPEDTASYKLLLLAVLQPPTEIKDEKIADSLYRELVYLSKNEYARNSNLSTTALYLEALFRYGFFKMKKKSDDTIVINQALKLIAAKIKESPGLQLTSFFIKHFDAYREILFEDNDGGEILEKRLLSMISTFEKQTAARGNQKDYSFILSYLQYCLTTVYDDWSPTAFNAAFDPDSRAARAGIKAIHYGGKLVEKDQRYTIWLSRLIRNFEPSVDEEALEDSCINAVRKLYTNFEEKPPSDSNTYKYAIAAHACLEGDFIEEDDIAMVIYKALAAFQGIYKKYVDNPGFIDSYIDFLDFAEEETASLDDAQKHREVVWERYRIEEERMELQPAVYASDYAEALLAVIEDKLLPESCSEAEHFLDSLIQKYSSKAQGNPAFKDVRLALYHKALPHLITVAWTKDTSVYSRWVHKYYLLAKTDQDTLPREEAGNGDNLLFSFMFLETEVTRLRSDTLAHLYEQSEDPEQRLALCKTALQLLQKPAKIDIHFVYDNLQKEKFQDRSKEISDWQVKITRVYLLRKAFSEAAASIELALESKTDNALAMLHKAHVLLFSGKYAEAVKLYGFLAQQKFYVKKAGTIDTAYILGDIAALQQSGAFEAVELNTLKNDIIKE